MNFVLTFAKAPSAGLAHADYIGRAPSASIGWRVGHAADVRMSLEDDLCGGPKPVWKITFKKADGAWKVAVVRR